jgi:hypothetical protein
VTLRRRDVFTTIGNWRQESRDMEFRGVRYTWSKHQEFSKFMALPSLSDERFELALARVDDEDRARLRKLGWAVVDATAFSRDPDTYRGYVASSRGEFSAAKEQNVVFRSGWFSDRSATYLAAGRPVVVQDTGFGRVLPTGLGLYAVRDLDEAIAAVGSIASDLSRNEAAAASIAAEYFRHDLVLGDMLATLGLPARGRPTSYPPAPATSHG